MEKTHNLFTNSVSCEAYFCQQDSVIFGVVSRYGDKHIHYGDPDKIMKFITEEMIPVFVCSEEGHTHDIEIRNDKNQVVHPYSFRGREIYLCPAFFGRKWSVWYDKQFFMDLSVDNWIQIRFVLGRDVLN